MLEGRKGKMTRVLNDFSVSSSKAKDGLDWSSVMVPGIWGNEKTEIKVYVSGCKKMRLDRQNSTRPIVFLCPTMGF